MNKLTDCVKTYTADQDKLVPPAETVARVRAVLAEKGEGILAETRRIDTGRLDIPVYMSICGDRAREVMPTRKQMGKGASPEQAEASALMELMERYSFFNFWSDEGNFERLTWSEAEARYEDRLIPVAEILSSVQETLPEDEARAILELTPWRFAPALHVESGETRILPLDWFKLLNEFNGSSAGNAFEESVLQGACELVERHVSAVVDADHPTLPTIDPLSIGDSVLRRLMDCFTGNGIKVWLKDMTLGFPVATVGALAYDPSTFPTASEIVFTAGTASSPTKAAIRALTEVAQLAGDFHTASNYEASGLAKYTELPQIGWLTEGPAVALDSLPSVESDNIREELEALARGLSSMGYPLYTVSTTHPELGIPTNYNLVPGFKFRERSRRACLGLFVGRKLVEEADHEEAVRGLARIAKSYPQAHFLSFYEGMAALSGGDAAVARLKFEKAERLQPDDENRALAAFYAGYALTQEGRFAEAVPYLDRAISLDGEVKEFFNLRGVCRFKAKDYRSASADFRAALDLDSGSAMDLANLGLCHKFLGEDAAAIDYLESALRHDPGLDFARGHLDELRARNEA